VRTAIAAALAAMSGLYLAYADQHTDDTGIVAGLLALSALVITLVAPTRWWLVALLVGLPLPIVETALNRTPGPFVALVFALGGALLGAGLSRMHVRPSHPASRSGPG